MASKRSFLGDVYFESFVTLFFSVALTSVWGVVRRDCRDLGCAWIGSLQHSVSLAAQLLPNLISFAFLQSDILRQEVFPTAEKDQLMCVGGNVSELDDEMLAL